MKSRTCVIIGNAFKASHMRASSSTLRSSYYDFNSQSLTLILRLLGKREPRKQDEPTSGATPQYSMHKISDRGSLLRVGLTYYLIAYPPRVALLSYHHNNTVPHPI